jgi:hypothetical protein
MNSGSPMRAHQVGHGHARWLVLCRHKSPPLRLEVKQSRSLESGLGGLLAWSLPGPEAAQESDFFHLMNSR